MKTALDIIRENTVTSQMELEQASHTPERSGGSGGDYNAVERAIMTMDASHNY